jgi:acetylornithine deacetylase/succinyl-diaminopimelate desuccinylase-like protein
MPAPDAVLNRLSVNEPASIRRWMDWLRIPSISTDPAYKAQTAQAAQWCADQFKELGFTVKIVQTGTIGADGKGSGHPVVLATIQGRAGIKAPHVLFYGHYDVQPVDPVELWKSPPFEPTLQDVVGRPIAIEDAVKERYPGPINGGARVVARGAVDDKGQVMMFLEACRATKDITGHATNGVAYTCVIEGEEECGSVNLEAFVVQHQHQLSSCDFCLISDTGMLARDKPAITYGVRGLAYTEITLHGANQDLHSGLWGGRCPNPITELTKVLAQLHDKKRKVTIPGFYDAVVPLTKEERANWKELKYNSIAALKKIGLNKNADIGEAGYSALEREWGRPTAEINGIWGGYTGQGAKTVIPSKASAKVSFRLVANQNPKKIAKMFFKWLESKTPPGCKWEMHDHHGGFGVTTPIDSSHMQAASRAIKRATGKVPALIKSGGSIPVAGMLKDKLGLDTIFMGFGLDDDRVHSPNEKFELSCFRMGARSHALFMDELRRP